ncbi:MAG TPA: excinuclease ABC subunit UvrC [Polyangiaceae bacterium]|nr:excinuclease ABC subunit UvrC [Polyangiaceae bacterium]
MSETFPRNGRRRGAHTPDTDEASRDDSTPAASDDASAADDPAVSDVDGADLTDGAGDELPDSSPAEPRRASEPRAVEPAWSADELETRLGLLPARPGCYIFRDRRGEVLYVGKAKSLRSRVRSYFQAGSSDDRAFLPFLRSAFGRFETIVTETEKEAAILENSLIKEQRPRFNVKLRDDKEFLTLRLDSTQDWPRLDLVRRPEPDRARYFGPYHSATAARRTLHLVEKHFQLRTCSDRDFETRKRPCLQYQIKRCSGPCVYDVDKGLYDQQVRAVSLFLEGRHDELSRELDGRMRSASDDLEFELAALYRDQIQAVESVRQQQRVVAVTDKDQDIVGLYREGDLVELAVLYVRSGRVIEAASFSQPRVEVPDSEVIASYLRDHYGDEALGSLIPDEVIVPVLPDGADGVEEWISERRAAAATSGRKPRKTQLLCPERGDRRQLLKLAQDNAQHAFLEKRRAEQDVDERLGRLQQKLRLPTLPRHIECIDISHLGGQDTYGSIVALKDGAPNKRDYRTYKVKVAAAGDDYGAIYEVLSRRFIRGKQAQADASGDERPDWALPDLLVVDGGRGQLGVALAAARDLGLHQLQIVGLAKEKENVAGDKLIDRVYLPGQKNPVGLRPNAPELFILARARDEAHRFANRSRSKAGKRRRLASTLDAVAGIGPKTRQALLRNLGGLARIRDASDEQLLAIQGVTARHVKALRAHFAAAPAADTSDDAAELVDGADVDGADASGLDESVGDGDDEAPIEEEGGEISDPALAAALLAAASPDAGRAAGVNRGGGSHSATNDLEPHTSEEEGLRDSAEGTATELATADNSVAGGPRAAPN